MKYFETTIKVPLPDGLFERAKVIQSLEAAFDGLAKGLAKAAIEGVEVKQREYTVKGPRAAKTPETEINPDRFIGTGEGK